MIETVLLDVDGTIIDSNDAHAESWAQALALEGISVPFSQVRPFIGMGGDHLLPMVSGFTEASDLGKKVSEHRKKIFREQYLPHLHPFPRARELLEKMREIGLRLVVASSSDEESLTALLEAAKVSDLVEDWTSKDDADQSKPEPDIVIAALRRAQTHASKALMLGDTPYDISAASRAGVRTVALLCGGWSVTSLARAIAIYRDPADLLEQFDTSPFNDSGSRQAQKLITY